MEALSRFVVGLIQAPTERRPRRPVFDRNGTGILNANHVIAAIYVASMIGFAWAACVLATRS